MHIILGDQAIEKLDQKYTILELDTLSIQNSEPIKAYCVVQEMSLDELTKSESYKNLHANLMEQYAKRNWNFCEQAIEKLKGFWGKELDSFYDDLLIRVSLYKVNEPPEDWSPVVKK